MSAQPKGAIPASLKPASGTRPRADSEGERITLPADAAVREAKAGAVPETERSLAPVALAIDAEPTDADAHALMAAFAAGVAELNSAMLELEPVSSPTAAAELSESSVEESTEKMSTPQLAALSHRLRAIVRNVTTGPLQLSADPESLAAVGFALVALVDEWLISQVHWSGAEAWSQQPLELQMYGSTTAGRVLFTQMEALADSRVAPATRRQLAGVYLLCLRLGFCGEWRGAEEQLMSYRRQLLQWLPQGEPDEDAFPQAYAHCKSGAVEERLAPLSRFWKWCALGLLVYCAVSLLLWMWLSQPLVSLLQELN